MRKRDPATTGSGPVRARRHGRRPGRLVAIALLGAAIVGCVPTRPAPPATQELRIILRADPRTFNPVRATDAVSAGLLALTHGTLFRIDARTQAAVPALAQSLEGPDASGALTLTLRPDVMFPDGEPFDAADVEFSLAVFQDPALGALQLQSLRVGGQPTKVRVLGPLSLQLAFGAPHPDPARLLAGVPMLPRHALGTAYTAGDLDSVWGLSEPPEHLIGLGPYRLSRYAPGQEVQLVRNEAYWRRDATGARLPFVDRIRASIVAQPDAQVARLLAGEVDVLSALDTRAFATLLGSAASGLELFDLGPSLEYTFLTLNLDDPAPGNQRAARRARWFHETRFRQALSLAVDRAALVRLVYDGRATALGSHVSPGNVRWSAGTAPPDQSLDDARRLLAASGFRWNETGRLVDRDGAEVSFTVLTSTSNPQRQRIATVLQADFEALGIAVQVAALEFRALVDRVTRTRDFDTAIMALGGADADPNAELSVWQRDGATHLFRLGAPTPLAAWEVELDALMREQATALDLDVRHALYARVQALVAEQLPIVPLLSPHHLVATRHGLAGVSPGVTSRDSLWNVDEWWWSTPSNR